jgi:Fic family protein
LRSESASSSQIEALTANARNLALATLGLSSKQNATLVAANVASMQAALEVQGPISADSILAVHKALLVDSQPEIAGRWREEQVWIGASSLSPHGADFVPPHHDHLSGYIDDLVAFVARDDLATLAQSAIAHAQFETIHPFVDGNGRTGRVLLQSVLRWRGLTRISTIPISAGLLRNTAGYFHALSDYHAGNVDSIIQCVAKATCAAIENSRILTAEFEALRANWLATLTARSDGSALALLDTLFEQPVIDAAFATTRLGVTDRTARDAIAQLESHGILSRTGQQRRGITWQAPEVLALLDQFAARAGRRSFVA